MNIGRFVKFYFCESINENFEHCFFRDLYVGNTGQHLKLRGYLLFKGPLSIVRLAVADCC